MEAPVLGSHPGADLCQGESGSGASLGAAIASLTERFGVPAMAWVFRGDCCVLSESDSRCAEAVL